MAEPTGSTGRGGGKRATGRGGRRATGRGGRRR